MSGKGDELSPQWIRAWEKVIQACREYRSGLHRHVGVGIVGNGHSALPFQCGFGHVADTAYSGVGLGSALAADGVERRVIAKFSGDPFARYFAEVSNAFTQNVVALEHARCQHLGYGYPDAHAAIRSERGAEWSD